jgi:hypothetical protein
MKVLLAKTLKAGNFPGLFREGIFLNQKWPDIPNAANGVGLDVADPLLPFPPGQDPGGAGLGYSGYAEVQHGCPEIPGSDQPDHGYVDAPGDATAAGEGVVGIREADGGNPTILGNR